MPDTYLQANMLTKTKTDYLKLVLSDADLVDVDFSRWDNVVSIYVVADHVPHSVPDKRELVALRFHGVRKFEWSFRHHDFKKFPLKTDPRQHLEWNIYKCTLAVGAVSALMLSGSQQFPIIRLRFEDVEIEAVDHAVFADVNPEWTTDGIGLGRPGIEALQKLFKRKSARRS